MRGYRLLPPPLTIRYLSSPSIILNTLHLDLSLYQTLDLYNHTISRATHRVPRLHTQNNAQPHTIAILVAFLFITPDHYFVINGTNLRWLRRIIQPQRAIMCTSEIQSSGCQTFILATKPRDADKLRQRPIHYLHLKSVA